MWFLPSLWFLGELVVFAELVVFGRDCGSTLPNRDRGKTEQGFDDRLDVVLEARIGGGYEYD